MSNISEKLDSAVKIYIRRRGRIKIWRFKKGNMILMSLFEEMRDINDLTIRDMVDCVI